MFTPFLLPKTKQIKIQNRGGGPPGSPPGYQPRDTHTQRERNNQKINARNSCGYRPTKKNKNDRNYKSEQFTENLNLFFLRDE